MREDQNVFLLILPIFHPQIFLEYKEKDILVFESLLQREELRGNHLLAQTKFDHPESRNEHFSHRQIRESNNTHSFFSPSKCRKTLVNIWVNSDRLSHPQLTSFFAHFNGPVTRDHRRNSNSDSTSSSVACINALFCVEKHYWKYREQSKCGTRWSHWSHWVTRTGGTNRAWRIGKFYIEWDQLSELIHSYHPESAHEFSSDEYIPVCNHPSTHSSLFCDY